MFVNIHFQINNVTKGGVIPNGVLAIGHCCRLLEVEFKNNTISIILCNRYKSTFSQCYGQNLKINHEQNNRN